MKQEKQEEEGEGEGREERGSRRRRKRRRSKDAVADGECDVAGHGLERDEQCLGPDHDGLSDGCMFPPLSSSHMNATASYHLLSVVLFLYTLRAPLSLSFPFMRVYIVAL